MKTAFDSEWRSMPWTSFGWKSMRMGTAIAPIVVMAKNAIPQFGLFSERSATLSPGMTPWSCRRRESSSTRSPNRP